MPGVYRFSGVIYDDIKKVQIGFIVTEDTGNEHKISFKQALKLYDQNRLVDCLLKSGRTPYFCGRNGLKISELPVYKFKDNDIVPAKSLRVGVEVVEAENYMDTTEKILYKIKEISEQSSIHLGRIRDKADSYGRFKTYTAAFRVAGKFVGQITAQFYKSKQVSNKTVLEVIVSDLPQIRGIKYRLTQDIKTPTEQFNAVDDLVDITPIAAKVAEQLKEFNKILSIEKAAEKLTTIGKLFTYTYYRDGISLTFMGNMGLTRLLSDGESIEFEFSTTDFKDVQFLGKAIYTENLSILIANGPELHKAPLNMAKSFLKEALDYYCNKYIAEKLTSVVRKFSEIIPQEIKLENIQITCVTPSLIDLNKGETIDIQATVGDYTHIISGTVLIKSESVKLKVGGPVGTPAEKKYRTIEIKANKSSDIQSQREFLAKTIQSYYT